MTTNRDRWLKENPAFAAAYKGPRPVEREPAKAKPHIIERTANKLRFVIPGQPIGAPRMTRSDKWKRRACVVRYMEWRNELEPIRRVLPPVASITSLSWVAYFEPPTTLNKKKLTKQEKAALLGQAHRASPDRDNIDKAILDGLFPEDKGIAAGGICKVWGTPARLEVEIVCY